jgi:hypothetical protein
VIKYQYLHIGTLRVYDIKGTYTKGRVTYVVLYSDRTSKWYSLTGIKQKDGTITVAPQPPMPLSARPNYEKYILPIQMEVTETGGAGI